MNKEKENMTLLTEDYVYLKEENDQLLMDRPSKPIELKSKKKKKKNAKSNKV